MKNILKRMMSLILAFLLIITTGATKVVLAEGENTPLQEGETRITKTANPVEGKVNTWQIKVRIDAKDELLPTDYVVILDRSGSMGLTSSDGGSRLQQVQYGSKKLIDRIFEENPDNRIDLVSFSSDLENLNVPGTFYNSAEDYINHSGGLLEKSDANIADLKSDIDNLKAAGGTFTQMALHKAEEILAEAHAADTEGLRQRVMILLTDGKPTVSYGIDWSQDQDFSKFFDKDVVIKKFQRLDAKIPEYSYIDDSGVRRIVYYHEVFGGIELTEPFMNVDQVYHYGWKPSSEFFKNDVKFSVNTKWVNEGMKRDATNANIPESAFIYDNVSRIGWGYPAKFVHLNMVNNDGSVLYGNLLNHTIAETKFINEKGNVDELFVLGYEPDNELANELKALPFEEDKYESVFGNEVEGAFKRIVERVVTKPIKNAIVTDVIAPGFGQPKNISVSGSDNNAIYDATTNTINWNLVTPGNIVPGAGIRDDDGNLITTTERWAEVTYEIEIDPTIVDVTAIGGNLYKTNGETKVEYNKPTESTGMQKHVVDVDSPKVDPVFFNVDKKVLDVDGNDITADESDKEFTINVNGQVFNGSYKLNPGIKKVNITDLRDEGDYTVSEVYDTNKYEVKYKINGVLTNSFTIAKELSVTEDVDDIDIEVINKLIPYNVLYEFVSGTPGKTLPQDVLNIKPATETKKISGEEVTPKMPTMVKVNVEGGAWNFIGYDKTKDTIFDKDVTFTGKWVYEETYKATHEFVSGDPTKELPQEVKDLLPANQTDLANNTTVTPTQPNKTSVEVTDGTWSFEGYDPENATIDGADENFVGTWSFTEISKKTTKFVDLTTGEEIADTVIADEFVAEKTIDGYKYVETVDQDGLRVHKYIKNQKITKWIDEDGNELLPTTTSPNYENPAEIPGYEHEKTVDKDNVRVHIYFKVISTTWVDEFGNQLKDTETSRKAKESGEFDNYEFVRTIIDDHGNVKHIFKKVVPTLPETGFNNDAATYFGLISLMGALSLLLRRKKETE